MAQPSARIRRIVAADDKEVRFMIGKATMEPLTTANRLTCTHPITIAVWVALSSIFVQYMKWWPNPAEHGWYGYLSPLPAFASVAVPIIAFMDWINRPYFDRQIYDVLRRPDMIDIVAHYSRQPSSALWILEFNSRKIALVALDSEGPSSAMVRHFYIDEQYIPSHVQDDLLSHAINHAFGSNPELERITAPDSPLTPHLGKSLLAVGFQLDENAATETIGLFRWKIRMRVLHRGVWKNAEDKD